MIKKGSTNISKYTDMETTVSSEASMGKSPNTGKQSSSNFLGKLILVGLLGVAVFFLAQKYRGLFVAAMVNTKPITRWELNSKLTERYGQTVLDEIIKENLIKEEAAKKKITVSDKEIADEYAKLEVQSGGKDALLKSAKAYGLSSVDQIKQYIRFSLVSKKLGESLFKDSVTDADVKKFFDDNKQTLDGKKLEDISEDIKAYLIQSKMAPWVEDLRAKAKVQSFI